MTEERNSLHADFERAQVELTKARTENTELVDEIDHVKHLLDIKQSEAQSLRTSMKALRQQYGRSRVADRASRRSAEDDIKVGYTFL